MDETTTVLVTGATGNVGREVALGLARRGVRVRALTRDPEGARLPSAIEVVRGSQRELRGLEGVDAVFLMWPGIGDLAAAREADATIAAHTGRVVFLSSAAVRDGVEHYDNTIGRSHHAIERAIRESGLSWTFLRPTAFATNLLVWAEQTRGGDVVRGAFGDVPVTLLDERDLAEVAVEALTDERYAGRVLELTGRDLLTPVEQVARIAERIGRPLHWEELPERDWRAGLLGSGFTEADADWFRESFEDMRAEPGPVLDTVELVTGRPPRTFGDWLSRHAAEFTDPAPEIEHPDAGLALVSTWTLDTSRRQRAAADAAMAAWGDAPWPAGLLSHSVLLGTDGRTVLNYSQWTGPEAVEAFRDTDPPERIRAIDDAVPGIRRDGLGSYTRYRSVVPDAGLRTGVVVLVSFETDGQRAARSFVDTLLDEHHPATRPDSEPVGGMASNHFHVAVDGSSVVNYAEFRDEAAHQAVVESRLRAEDAVPALIEATPGLRGLGFQRFLPYRRLTAPRPPVRD
ncbi:SDR family oxidoreductase [Prauserella cavernicola]|uniref:NAD(P)H-binding protein n=1 Tax=Prauserella cavernicola TaxID=2800127 RepID=A0A934QNJ2_9PSEU|nr:NAD(P)H-binding protein [Prauserella cavernicola]MBK1783151.1 NAD(P)H-binding protein [Prauserella cavernicola]